MLAFCFMRYWLGEIWFFKIDDMVDYVFRFIKSILGIIPVIFLIPVDIILSPIEIVAIITYCIKNKKKKV